VRRGALAQTGRGAAGAPRLFCWSQGRETLPALRAADHRATPGRGLLLSPMQLPSLRIPNGKTGGEASGPRDAVLCGLRGSVHHAAVLASLLRPGLPMVRAERQTHRQAAEDGFRAASFTRVDRKADGGHPGELDVAGDQSAENEQCAGEHRQLGSGMSSSFSP